MAKRKRGGRKGFTLNLAKDYRGERYVMYIMSAETGILQAATIDPELTDGEVTQTLDQLMSQLQVPDALTKLLPRRTADEAEAPVATQEGESNFVQQLILMNLRTAFERHGPLEAEDVIGILGVIKTSVKRWGHGPHRRGYLTYLEGFLGEMGVNVRQLSEEEVEHLEFIRPEQGELKGNNDE